MPLHFWHQVLAGWQGCKVQCTKQLPKASAVSIQISAAALLHHGCLLLRCLRTAFMSHSLVFVTNQRQPRNPNIPPDGLSTFQT